MAKIYQLKDRRGNKVYPVTESSCVLDGEGYLSDTLKDINIKAEEFVGDIEKVFGVTRVELKMDAIIDAWNELWTYGQVRHGQFNPDTRCFEGNGVTDIGLEEALAILRIGRVCAVGNTSINQASNASYIRNVRTIPPICCAALNFIFQGIGFESYSLEVLRFLSYYEYGKTIDVLDDLNQTARTIGNAADFMGGFATYKNQLRKILGVYSIANIANQFNADLPLLEEFWMQGLNKDMPILLKKTPEFKLECFRYMIEHSTATTPITVTVHADIYSRLTDSSHSDWYRLNQDAMAKQVLFASA